MARLSGILVAGLVISVLTLGFSITPALANGRVASTPFVNTCQHQITRTIATGNSDFRSGPNGSTLGLSTSAQAAYDAYQTSIWCGGFRSQYHICVFDAPASTYWQANVYGQNVRTNGNTPKITGCIDEYSNWAYPASNCQTAQGTVTADWSQIETAYGCA